MQDRQGGWGGQEIMEDDIGGVGGDCQGQRRTVGDSKELRGTTGDGRGQH